MAKAYERASKRVDAVSEALLAELIQRDVQQLTEDALEKGVTAYLQRPVQRERLNERFLQSTIRGVQHSNRRAEESEAWDRHRKQQQSRQQRQRSRRLPSPTSSGTSDGTASSPREQAGPSQDDGLGELEVLDLLARRRVKGRGAIGSRADEPGPFLPPGADGYRDDDDSAAARPVLGPSVPDWVRQQLDEGAAAAAPPPRRYLTGASADFAAAEAALAVAAAARKARKKEKKRKRKEAKALKEGGKRPQKRKK